MTDILHTCFSGSVLPASVLLLLVNAYWLFVILGALDIDVLDLDLDLDTDADVGWFSSTGAVVLKFLNVGRIPTMVWLSMLALVLWIISVVWHEPVSVHDDWLALQVFLRNLVLAVIVTKIVTQPMLRLLAKSELRTSKDLLGKVCVISTPEATAQHGQAKVATEGAPLLLHVRTRDAVLRKGDRATIVDYDPATLIYYVEKVENEVDA